MLQNSSCKLSSWCRHSPPIFLAPLLARTSPTIFQSSPFSTSTPFYQRKQARDGNPNRGVSALRRTGIRKRVSISSIVKREGLPQPVLDPKRRTKVEVDDAHGLYGFFNPEKQLLTKPIEENQHGQWASLLMTSYRAYCVCIGRAWTPAELRHKSWEDIHSLWWICCKERNRLATEKAERERLKVGKGSQGELQAQWKDKEVSSRRESCVSMK